METASLQCDEDSEVDGWVVRPSSHQRLRVLHVHEVERLQVRLSLQKVVYAVFFRI